MVCVNLISYKKDCTTTSGGISDIAIFDPFDFDFTQAAPVNNMAQPYSAITLRAGATSAGGGKVYPVTFQQDEAEWTHKQSVKGCSVKWDHEFKFMLTNNSQTLTVFQQALDAAGCCCGIGVFVRLNSQKIFVAGERYVNGTSIPKFIVKQDGTEGTSGKVMDDPNQSTISLKGSYIRNLYEYTGTWESIEALM